jgi:hypothetical protein
MDPFLLLGLPYEQTDLHAIKFLQGLYGFVITYFSYEGMAVHESC